MSTNDLLQLVTNANGPTAMEEVFQGMIKRAASATPARDLAAEHARLFSTAPQSGRPFRKFSLENPSAAVTSSDSSGA